MTTPTELEERESRQMVLDAAFAVARFKPMGACSCQGPDGPCENCEANREAHEELCRELNAFIDALQTDAYAEGRRDEQQELSNVLPGTAYMDPPDGGAPTVLEQLQRQAKDASRYMWLRRGGYPLAFAKSVLNDTPHGIDAAIDAAMTGKTL